VHPLPWSGISIAALFLIGLIGRPRPVEGEE